MSLDPLTSVFELGKSVIERIWPDANKRAEEVRKLEELRQKGDLAVLNAHVKLMLGQLEVNKLEAQSKSLFVAGWRPAVGWVCVVILAFNYIGIPILSYLQPILSLPDTAISQADMSDLWPVLLGMLGIGGMRSYDKKNLVQTDRL